MSIDMQSYPDNREVYPMKHLRQLLLACLLALFSVSALGCNTIRGAGEDLEKAGEAIEDAIE